jgi:2-haloacid dehalogenase
MQFPTLFMSWRMPARSDPDWFAALRLADAWRDEYQPAMDAVRRGELAFCKLDVLHRRNLDRVLDRLGLAVRADDALRRRLNLAWHHLDAWPDVTPALARLRERFLLAPCSNGNISLMVDLARRNGWVWDAVLGAEIARDYKPKPEVYRATAAAFDAEPHEVLMVAAHSSDLAAAAAAGLRTAFIARPDEHGPGRGETVPEVPVDIAANDLAELARRLMT